MPRQESNLRTRLGSRLELWRAVPLHPLSSSRPLREGRRVPNSDFVYASVRLLLVGARLTPAADLYSTARHEAGHAIAAHAVGRRVVALRCTPGRGTEPGAVRRSCTSGRGRSSSHRWRGGACGYVPAGVLPSQTFSELATLIIGPIPRSGGGQHEDRPARSSAATGGSATRRAVTETACSTRSEPPGVGATIGPCIETEVVQYVSSTIVACTRLVRRSTGASR